MLKSEVIKNFLMASTHEDLAINYSKEMEVQVIVDQGNGERAGGGDFKGKSNTAYTDGVQTWYPFRIPKNANTFPIDNDSEIKYDIAKHALGIGMTGWNWVKKESIYLGYDFDAIIGHSSKHTNKLTSSELYELEHAVSDIPWVSVRRSTSGTGRHLYVYVRNISTANHDEHAALARSILGVMSGITGFDFYSKVDTYGSNMWVWHRKMLGTNGLEIIKQGNILDSIPENWRDHISVVSGKRKKTIPSFIIDSDTPNADEQFLELTGQRARIPFDDTHKKLISYLQDNNFACVYDAEHHMIITHTHALKKAHEELNLKGVFDTNAQGTEHGDHNSFMFSIPQGAWSVRRYTRGITETPTWTQDNEGWTRCFLNKTPDLKTAARVCDGLEHPTGGYVFPCAEDAQKAASMLGINLDIPNWALGKKSKLKENREGKLVAEIDLDNQIDAKHGGMKGWIADPKQWKKVFETPLSDTSEFEVNNFDDLVRHLISPLSADAGWGLKTRLGWQDEPINHVGKVLKNMGFKHTEVERILGSCIMKSWRIVNYPFQAEYPGNRQWNRNAAQFRYIPSPDKDNLSYPTWDKIFTHLGKNLDDALINNEWCQQNGVTRGSDYLKCWVASLFQHPEEPLPYLFFYGDEDTGKSSLHEALSMLIINGVKRADTALTSSGSFNGELENAILCVVEETDLRKNKSAINMIKDWVNSPTITIHKKGETAYDAINNMHFVQCSNDHNFCPIFSGDTRITMISVNNLEEKIAKRDFFRLLDKEAPDFLAAMLSIEMMPYKDRLFIPVITTDEKIMAQSQNKNELELFIEETCFAIDGAMIKFSDFYDKFIEHLDPNEINNWSKIKTRRAIPPQFPYGRDLTQGSQFYIGNISFENGKTKSRIICKEGRLIKLSEVITK